MDRVRTQWIFRKELQKGQKRDLKRNFLLFNYKENSSSNTIDIAASFVAFSEPFLLVAVFAAFLFLGVADLHVSIYIYVYIYIERERFIFMTIVVYFLQYVR